MILLGFLAPNPIIGPDVGEFTFQNKTNGDIVARTFQGNLRELSLGQISNIEENLQFFTFFSTPQCVNEISVLKFNVFPNTEMSKSSRPQIKFPRCCLSYSVFELSIKFQWNKVWHQEGGSW